MNLNFFIFIWQLSTCEKFNIFIIFYFYHLRYNYCSLCGNIMILFLVKVSKNTDKSQSIYRKCYEKSEMLLKFKIDQYYFLYQRSMNVFFNFISAMQRLSTTILFFNCPHQFLPKIIANQICKALEFIRTFLNIFNYFSNMDRQADTQLSTRILQTLKQSIEWARIKQAKLLSQVLDIQKKINNLHETKSLIRKKQMKIIEKQQKKEQSIVEEYSKKIDQMIIKAQQQINQLDNPNKKPKPASSTKVYKNVQPLPQIQKKPPLPTINRSKDPQLVTHKPNYHYRNKNEVTPKITQTPVIKSAGKFNSNSNLGKKEESIFKIGNSAQKTKVSVEKQGGKNQSLNATKISQNTNTNTNINQNVKQVKQIKKQSYSAEKKPKETVQYIDFSSFRIPTKILIERQSEKNQKRVGTKKSTIEQLISEYNKNQIGYKNNENKSMYNFLNSFNKLSATRSRLPIKGGIKIEPRNWQGHIQTFNFQNLLNTFQSLLDSNPISQQYAPNQKQAYKIKLWHKRINQIYTEQIQSTRQNLKLPPTLGIDFQMKNNLNQDIQIFQEGQNNGIQNPYTGRIYQLLQQQLNELKSLENFDKQALKKLRTLISIGIYNGKRSPVIIQTPKYEQWVQYYQS